MDRYRRSIGSGADFSAGMVGIGDCLGEIRVAASKLKSVDAQVALGSMLHRGDHLPQDCKQSVGWFRKAAQQGSTDAYYMLGSMYGDGHGIEKDQVEAYAWYLLAMEKGHARAHEEMTKIEPKLTSEQLAQAKRWAEEYRPSPDEGTGQPKPPENPHEHPAPSRPQPTPPDQPHKHPNSPGNRQPVPSQPPHNHPVPPEGKHPADPDSSRKQPTRPENQKPEEHHQGHDGMGEK
ncbi:MAG: SEL1-like repeat protein [Elusimicrobia bacterium]|nr:SEL1-like repeat protein [Elusimicrobiota bacterium]